MRGDLVYRCVMEGGVIKVLRDEVDRTYATFMLRWRAWGTTLLLTDIAEVGLVQQVREEPEVVLGGVCSFRELGPVQAFKGMNIKHSVVRQREGWRAGIRTFSTVLSSGGRRWGGDNNNIGGRTCTYQQAHVLEESVSLTIGCGYQSIKKHILVCRQSRTMTVQAPCPA